GLEAGAYRYFGIVLLQNLELFDVRIHVGIELHPVEIVVAIDVRAGREIEFLAPALEEAAPKEVADRHTIGFLMAQRRFHASQFGLAVLCPLQYCRLCIHKPDLQADWPLIRE